MSADSFRVSLWRARPSLSLVVSIVPPSAARAERARRVAARDLKRYPAVTIVVVTLDGVRWHEVFDGVDPALARERGLPPEAVVGAAELMPSLHARSSTRRLRFGAPGHGVRRSALRARTSYRCPGTPSF